jgi:hypothetical protein
VTQVQPQYIATQDDLNRGAFAKVVRTYLQSNDTAYLDVRLASAAQAIEEMCGNRRLMPFTLTENPVADGVNPDQGEPSASLRDMGALGFAADLDYGRPTDFGSSVRDLWVDQYPPTRSDLWTYSDVSISIRPLWGGVLNVPTSGFHGPDETGHIILNLGILCPLGSPVTITYSGGYTEGYPLSLIEATRLETIRQLMLELDPGQTSHIDADALMADVLNKLLPYGAGRPK